MIIKNPAFSSPVMVLFEDKASDYVKKMIKQHCSYTLRPYLDYKVSDLPDSLKSHLKEYNQTLFEKCMENGANLTMFFRLDFLQYFDIRRGKGPEKYIIGLARIAIGELGYFNNMNTISDMALLKQLVLFAYNNDDVNKSLDSNFNGMTFYELKTELNEKRKEYNKSVQKALFGKANGNKKYTVVSINSQEDAERYGKYTSWCVTHGSYNSYAKNGSRFYFCLNDGFENVKEEVGEGCPLDIYGLSMVSVLIDMDGEPIIVTTRWNHKHDGENNENLHTAEQVQKVLGIPFYETFKPYTKEELKQMGIVSFDDAKERLENGEDPNKIFKYVDKFHNGVAVVSLNGKRNYINTEGKLLSDKWFNVARSFNFGYGIVFEHGKGYNLIQLDGKLLSDKWFEDVSILEPEFEDNVAIVTYGKKYNILKKNGKLLSDEWFDNIFGIGKISVLKNGKWYVVDKNGNLNMIEND